MKEERQAFELKNISVNRFEEEYKLLSMPKTFFKTGNGSIINRSAVYALSARDEVTIKLNGEEKGISIKSDIQDTFMDWLTHP